jgi:hypothetical protein
MSDRPADPSKQRDRLAAAAEIDVAPRRADGTLAPYTTIWIVAVGDDLYVRSYRGPRGSWYRTARHTGRGRIRTGGDDLDVTFADATDISLDAADDAYRAKYGRSPYVDAMVARDARATTLKANAS